MNEQAAVSGTSKVKLAIIASFGVLIVGGIIGFLIYSSVCPCERTPGGFLFGDNGDAQVDDWSFANQVPLCQLQIYAGIRPHSINLNCMATSEGEMYLSCSVCDTKYWASKVGENEVGSMRLDGVVYKVQLNRITDATTMDRAWAARVAKLQMHGGPGNPAPDTGTPRADRWWTFRVESRS